MAAENKSSTKVEEFVASVSRRLESEGLDFQIEVRPVALGPGLSDVFIELATGRDLFVMCAEHAETARVVTESPRREYDVHWRDLPERVRGTARPTLSADTPDRPLQRQ